MRPALELGVLGINRIIQALGGRLAEPLATLVARPFLRAVRGGERVATRNGLRWRIDLANNLERRLYFVGSYERATICQAKAHLRPGDVVLDVGANIGTFALPLAKVGARVIAVEAASDSASRLLEHVRMNNLEGRINVIHLALGKERARVELRTGSKADTGLRTLTGTGDVIEMVDVMPGDELLANLGLMPDVVKVDVEGAELMVFRGMPKALSRARVIFVEVVHRYQARGGESVANLVEYLRALGFHPWHIRNRGLEEWRGQSGNAMFVRD